MQALPPRTWRPRNLQAAAATTRGRAACGVGILASECSPTSRIAVGTLARSDLPTSRRIRSAEFMTPITTVEAVDTTARTTIHRAIAACSTRLSAMAVLVARARPIAPGSPHRSAAALLFHRFLPAAAPTLEAHRHQRVAALAGAVAAAAN